MNEVLCLPIFLKVSSVEFGLDEKGELLFIGPFSTIIGKLPLFKMFSIS